MTELRPDDVLPLLRALAETGAVLIGGQALNVWCEVYRSRVPSFAAAVFTSKDVDAQATHDDVRRLGDLLGARPLHAKRGDITNTGYLEIDVDGRSVGVNLLQAPLGLDKQEVIDTAISIEYQDVTIRVLHPVLCMEGRVATLCGLAKDPANERSQAMAVPIATLCGPPKDPANERSQAQASVLCARAWIEDVAAEDSRAALALCERVFRFARSNVHAKTARRDQGVDAFAAVQPWPSLPAAFGEKRYPEMRRQLYERRPRSR